MQQQWDQQDQSASILRIPPAVTPREASLTNHARQLLEPVRPRVN